MLPPIDRYQYQPYEQLYIRPWYCQPEGPLAADHPQFMPLMNQFYAPRVEAVRTLLLDELQLSDAPYSNMHTACVIATERITATGFESKVYSGHREETLSAEDGFRVVTATEMALGKIACDDETICGVYLTGRDLPGGKLKRLMPIPTDYDHIVRRFSQDWGTPFFIIPPDSYGQTGLQGVQWVLSHKHVQAYAQHDYIRLSEYAEEAEDLATILQNYTHLKAQDAQFVADFTRASLAQNWTTFFTGSASGVGEITPCLTDEYDDMDFIVVADDPESAEAAITTLAQQHYGALTKVPEVAYDTYGGKKIKGFFLFNKQGKKLIQLAIGTTMDEVCFRPDVIERNSGIWLHDSRQMQAIARPSKRLTEQRTSPY